ncbi:hypothetical protein [Streptomyces sp. ISL-100]|uniref:hypothetical protein n=1 Tax=Streptomyces sp. ISL-100 TaxID=2819173 RepID=UPI001BEA4EDB|nr:hypothetical protein [Streptomyces sp. ISL-100]MBT2400629.1 hypothetical protein [Streptomyces sp. ISL-100]
MNDDNLRRYMPTGGRLLLLLRAALTYSNDGGPFLVIRKSGAVYRHDVQVSTSEPNLASMTALTGEDALAFAHMKGWQSVMDPTAEELRTLMHQAVTLRDVAWWASDFDGYSDYLASPTAQERMKMIKRAHASAAARARVEYIR